MTELVPSARPGQLAARTRSAADDWPAEALDFATELAEETAMSPRVTFTQPAEPGTQFAPDAFGSQIGRNVPVNIEGHEIDGGKILAAQVADDGKSVDLTVEVPSGTLPQPPVGPGSFSLGE